MSRLNYIDGSHVIISPIKTYCINFLSRKIDFVYGSCGIYLGLRCLSKYLYRGFQSSKDLKWSDQGFTPFDITLLFFTLLIRLQNGQINMMISIWLMLSYSS